MLSQSKQQPLPNLNTNETPLLLACNLCLPDIAKALLKHSPGLMFISESKDVLSPLHVACIRGHIEIVEAILHSIFTFHYESEVQFSLDFRDSLGRTPFYCACYYGHIDVARLLVQFQHSNSSLISFNVNAAVKDSQRTSLHEAVSKQQLDLVNFLVTVNGININAEGLLSEKIRPLLSKAIQSIKNYFETCGIETTLSDNDLQMLVTPLVEACALFDVKITKILLMHGARDKCLALLVPYEEQRFDFIKLYLSYHCILLRREGMVDAAHNMELIWSNMELKSIHQSWLDCNSEFYPHALDDSITDSFPEFKVRFDAVHTVNLNDNKLTELPVELFQLPNVRKIDVSGNCINSLSGSMILSHKCGHSLLTELNLSRNRLNDLPSTIWSLPKLSKLYCSDNSLSSNINLDEEQALLYTSLITVDFSKNIIGMKDLRGLFTLPNLEVLTVSNSHIKKLPDKYLCRVTRSDSSFPPNCKAGIDSQGAHPLSAAPSLRTLDLSDNELRFFPVNFPCLVPNLKELDLSGNSLAEIDIHSIPSQIRKLTARRCGIRFLGDRQSLFFRCQHTSHLQFEHLEVLDLSSNKFTNIELLRNHYMPFINSDYRSDLTSSYDLLYPLLERLDLSNNRLTGEFNHNIGHQKHLKYFILDNNKLLEKIPVELVHLKNLKGLSMKNLPNLIDPPAAYQHVGMRQVLTYMRARLKE